MEIGTTSQACEPAVLRLPVEILQDIFRIVARESTTVRSIRLTCRFWCSLVDSDHASIRHIATRNPPKCRDMHYPSNTQWDHCVHSAEQLTRALECIGDAQFHFDIAAVTYTPKEVWTGVPWHRFTVKCSGLSISSWTYHQDDIVNSLPSLPALSYLLLRGNDAMSSTALSPLRLISPNNQLQEFIWHPRYAVSLNVRNFTHVFAFLTKLELQHHGFFIPVNDLVELFSSLRQLQDFAWLSSPMHSANMRLIRSSTEWKFKPRRLVVNVGLITTFPPSTLSQLEVLTDDQPPDNVVSNSISEATELDHLHLPQAKEITLYRPWSPFTHLEALNLERLFLRTGYRDFKYLARMTINPQFAQLHAGEMGKVLEAFLARGPFTNLTKLYLYVDIRWASADGHLAQILSVDIVREKMPQLRNLLIDWSTYVGNLKAAMVMEKHAKETSDAFGNRPYTVELV
ncbi:hypothetical protein FRC17_002824 [Serendipita sp. 399]|nr:hypothetical protein FRC17_002824 [Serendipita sp. 399]